MRRTKQWMLVALLWTAVLSLVGCNQMNREEITPHHEDDQLEVFMEMYLQEADGTLTLLSDDLRAVTGNTSLGTVTGDGKYDYNASVTLTVTAKGSYTLHKLYEESGKGGFTEAKGVVNQKSETKEFNVTDNMNFVAIFSALSDSDLGYQKLKLAGRESDHSKTVDGDSELSESLLAVGEEVQAVKTPSGAITSWVVRNPEYKDWEIKDKNATWLSATIFGSTGRISITATPHISKTQGARTATFKVGKDGTTSQAPKVWRTVTITQNSYYEETESPAHYEFGDGSRATIPTSATLVIPAEGGTKDLRDAHEVLRKPLFAVINVYKNGVQSGTIKKPVTVTFGEPANNWLTKSGHNVSAPKNSSGNRMTRITASFKVEAHEVATLPITIRQEKANDGVDIGLE